MRTTFILPGIWFYCQRFFFYIAFFFLFHQQLLLGESIRGEELKPDNFLIRRSEVTNSSVTFEIIFIDIKHLVYVGFPNG